MTSIVPADTDTSSSAPAAPASATQAAGGASPRAPGLPQQGNNAVRVLAICALIVALGAVAVSAWSWQRSERTVREAARRWQDAETRTAQVEQQAKLAQDEVRELVGRAAVLENKLAETAGQLAQLERIYKNIAQDSLDAVLADVENAVSIAAQQLLVGGNVQGALVALQDAESTLKRGDAASVSTLRRLIARDIDRLRAVPITDIGALAVRLDSVAAGVDQYPLLSGAAVPAGKTAADAGAAGAQSTIDRLASSGLRGWNALRAELQSLIRVNRIDAPDAVLLAPEQQYFVRENLRMTLLGARLALLSRNDPVFKSDLGRAIDWLGTYYDRDNRSVANAVASLRQLQANRVAVELPSLAESLGAVRAMRASRESAR